MMPRLAALLVPTALATLAAHLFLPRLGYSPAMSLGGTVLVAVLCLAGGLLGVANGSGRIDVESPAAITASMSGVILVCGFGYINDAHPWLVAPVLTVAVMLVIAGVLGLLCNHVEEEYA